MSERARKFAESFGFVDWATDKVAERAEPLFAVVEAAELYLKAQDSDGCAREEVALQAALTRLKSVEATKHYHEWKSGQACACGEPAPEGEF